MRHLGRKSHPLKHSSDFRPARLYEAVSLASRENLGNQSMRVREKLGEDLVVEPLEIGSARRGGNRDNWRCGGHYLWFVDPLRTSLSDRSKWSLGAGRQQSCCRQYQSDASRQTRQTSFPFNASPIRERPGSGWTFPTFPLDPWKVILPYLSSRPCITSL